MGYEQLLEGEGFGSCLVTKICFWFLWYIYKKCQDVEEKHH